MDTHSLARVASNVALTALPATPPATIVVWGPQAVELFGVNIPIFSMGASLVGLWMARGVAAAREGARPGGVYLTGVLTMIVIALVIEKRPPPGIGIACGLGVGASGIVAFDLLRDRFLAWFSNVLGAAFGKAPGGGDAP